MGGGVHPGARASRPHALPLRADQFPCDGAPGHPYGGNGMGRAQSARHRSTRVEQIAEALPRFVTGGTPGSRVGIRPAFQESDPRRPPMQMQNLFNTAIP